MGEMRENEEQPVLGIPEMDAQHAYLYGLFNRLGEDGSVVDTEETAALLHELEGYIDFHFTSEEHLVRHYKAPGFAEHQTDHEQAAHEFIKYLSEFERGELNPFRLRVFLTGWLQEHSRSIDMKYAEHIREARRSLSACSEP